MRLTELTNQLFLQQNLKPTGGNKGLFYLNLVWYRFSPPFSIHSTAPIRCESIVRRDIVPKIFLRDFFTASSLLAGIIAVGFLCTSK